jgi:hypothetical protein
VVTSGQAAGALLSVDVGMPQDVTWQGRTVHTAVRKKPVIGAGDGAAAEYRRGRAGRSGWARRRAGAVFVYQIKSYRYWQDQLHRDDFSYGQFGENFTVQGLADHPRSPIAVSNEAAADVIVDAAASRRNRSTSRVGRWIRPCAMSAAPPATAKPTLWGRPKNSCVASI